MAQLRVGDLKNVKLAFQQGALRNTNDDTCSQLRTMEDRTLDMYGMPEDCDILESHIPASADLPEDISAQLAAFLEDFGPARS